MKDANVKTSQSSNSPGKKSEADDIQDSAQTNHASNEEIFVRSDKIEIKPFKGLLSG